MNEKTVSLSFQVGREMYEHLRLFSDRHNVSIQTVVLVAVEKHLRRAEDNSERRKLHAALDRLLDKPRLTIVEQLVKEHIANSLSMV